jgi:hypothetical protein
MDPQINPAESYKRFVSWQCRLRKMSMRELGGRPTPGMSAGVYPVAGDEEKGRMNFLIVKQESDFLNTELRHIIRKTQDSAERLNNGLRILSERHYQDDSSFSDQLTALFGFDSGLADALIEAGECHLKFTESSIEYAFDFSVREIPEQDPAHQATYWHNHLFNPSMPGRVRILGFSPRLYCHRVNG